MRPPFILLALLLASCTTPADTERLQRIGDIALTYAERSGQISPQDAAIAREAGTLLLSKDAPAPTTTPTK